jgi:hypothetical protein
MVDVEDGDTKTVPAMPIKLPFMADLLCMALLIYLK